MAINLQNTIFERYYSTQDKVLDPNKDINGKGTAERYNEIIGQDVDQDLIPLIDDALDNLIVPETMLERYIPDRELSLGNIVLFLGFSSAMRRRIIKGWHRYVSIKGTILGYEVLFQMLGITSVTITEIFDTGGFDSATTFDSDIRPTFDSGRCKTCGLYTIDLVGPPLTTEIYNAIFSIILFNEPLNAELLDLTYNGLSINNVTPNFSYATAINGTHSPFVVNSSTALFWEFVAGAPFVISDSPTYTYLNNNTKTVNVFIDDFSSISEINFASQVLTGLFDLSNFNSAVSFDFSNNIDLDPVIFPTSNAANITLLDVSSSIILTADLSGFSNMGGIIRLNNNQFLTSLIFAAIKSPNDTIALDVSQTDLTVLNLEPLTLGTSCEVFATNCPSLTDFTTGATVNLNQIATVNLSNCPSLDTLAVANLRTEIGGLSAENCTALMTFDIGSSFVRSGVGFINLNNTSALTGSLDLQSFPLGFSFQATGSAFNQILHASSTTALSIYAVNDNSNLIYYDIKAVEGIIGEDDAIFNAANCGLNSTDVDLFLDDLVKICVTLRGEPVGGSFINRRVFVDGTNAAPTAAGLSSIATLNGLGITVFNN